ncbi:hypothetical protein J7K27_08195 [Candidatus Bathyarchaeota archaeon]|nr:hypothetical protein [Candidatus Bathyarchaeota archaeon]
MSKNNREVSRYWLIRQKLCKIGAFLEVSSFILAVLTVLCPKLWSLFIFSLIDWVLVSLPSFYLKLLEIRRKGEKGNE